MRVTFKFTEVLADSTFSREEVINSAVDYVMNNFFPEFEEEEIFPTYQGAEVSFAKQEVSLELNPVWLAQTFH
jgi:hypothetical protein